MSQDEWDALKPGDVVIEKRSRAPRVVLGMNRHWVTKGSPPHERVVLRLRKIRGKRCTITVLFPSDWRRRLETSGERATVTDEMRACPMHDMGHFDHQDWP